MTIVRGLLAATACMINLTGAIAGDLGFSAEEFGARLNDHAKAEKSSIRAVRTRCSVEAEWTCSYQIGTDILVAVSASRANALATRLISLQTGGQSPQRSAEGLHAYAAMIAILTPQADRLERGAILRRISEAVTKPKTGARTAEHGKVTMGMNVPEGLGIIAFSAFPL